MTDTINNEVQTYNVNSHIETLLNSKFEDDEKFLANAEYLQKLTSNSNVTEQKLRFALEDRELELNDAYLKNFERINLQVQCFVEKIQKMNTICHDLTSRIQSNKEKTRDLLSKTSILQNEKRLLNSKQEYFDEFFEKYSLNEQENRILLGSGHCTISTGQQQNSQQPISDAFFKAFKHLLEINKNVENQLKLNSDNLALLEISGQLQGKLDATYDTLYLATLRECRLLNVEFLEVKPVIYQSLEYLESRLELFERILEEYSTARRSNVVRAYIDVLTKGGKFSQRPIEQLSNEPIKYISEMFSWINGAIISEKDLIANLLKNCRPENVGNFTKTMLANISEGLCQPLKVRVDQTVSKENNSQVLYRLLTIFLYYAKTFESELGDNVVLVKVLYDLYELTSSMFFSVISSSVQRILSNMNVPDYDLLPVNSIHQCLLLLRDTLESQNDNTFVSVINKKEMYTKIFAHILDPLHQSIQLVSSNLHNPLDVAVYMLNCLNAIRSSIIVYQYTDSKLEMLKAQIDANEDVLVSEQASQILTNTDLMHIYTKSVAHQSNQGPLSKIPGMEPERISNAIQLFNNFLKNPLEGFQCHQTVRISSARSRESVQNRTFENVINAYGIIWSKLTNPENAYSLRNLKTPEEIRADLLK